MTPTPLARRSRTTPKRRGWSVWGRGGGGPLWGRGGGGGGGGVPPGVRGAPPAGGGRAGDALEGGVFPRPVPAGGGVDCAGAKEKRPPLHRAPGAKVFGNRR